MITNFALYNLSTGNLLNFLLSYINQKIIVKRKILIEKITSISLSTTSAEFVIHVPSEYDYRFSHPLYRNQIVFSIAKSFINRVYGPL